MTDEFWPGAEFGNAIDENLDSSDIILLLISPDFMASEYCYEKEMKRALARHAKGEARVIPVPVTGGGFHSEASSRPRSMGWLLLNG
jgi:hypothetical protein